MRKICISILILCLFFINTAFAVDNWTPANPAGGSQAADIDANVIANNNAVDRLFSYYRIGCNISYASASTVSVAAGSVVCSDTAGTTRKLRANTTATTVTWTNIDTGSEAASTTYYVYAIGDTDAATFTIVVSTNASTPGGTSHDYYKRLGSFYNDASSNITTVTNDDDQRISLVYDYGTSASAYTSRNIPSVKICYGTVSIAGNSTQAITNLPFTSSTSYIIQATYASNNTGISEDACGIPVSGTEATIVNADGGTQNVSWFAIGI